MNSADKGTISRDDVLSVLADRQWHTIAEIREELYPRIAPEVAAKEFSSNSNSVESFSQEHVVNKGKQAIVGSYIARLLYENRIESEGMRYDPQRAVRLIGWHCNGCGVRVHAAWECKPPHGCCDECHLAITGGIT